MRLVLSIPPDLKVKEVLVRPPETDFDPPGILVVMEDGKKIPVKMPIFWDYFWEKGYEREENEAAIWRWVRYVLES